VSRIVDNTGLNEDAIARGLAVANSVTINFSTVSEDRSTRLAIAHSEVRWHKDQFGETYSGMSEKWGMFTREGSPDPNGNGLVDIYTFEDKNYRPGVYATAMFHETLHHDRNIDRVVEQAINSSAFSSLDAEQKLVVSRILEEKAVRDTVKAVAMIDNRLPDGRLFEPNSLIANDLETILSSDSYRTITYSDGTKIEANDATLNAVRNYVANSYNPVDFVQDGTHYVVDADGKSVKVTAAGAATGEAGTPGAGGTDGSGGASPVIRDDSMGFWAGAAQVVTGIGAAIVRGAQAAWDFLSDVFTGKHGSDGDKVADAIEDSNDNSGQDNAKPLILDLDGDGVEINVRGDVSYDIDGDGFLEQTAWAGENDGFLIIDTDANGNRTRGDGTGDGRITHAKELTLSKWLGRDGATDLQALVLFDKEASWGGNNDGKLNAKDDVWSELKVWRDRNQNGVVDSGEMVTLDSLGITEIGLRYDDGTKFGDLVNDVTVNGSTLLGSTYMIRNGVKQESSVGDVSLAYNAEGWRRVDIVANGVVVGYEIQFEKGAKMRYATLRDDYAANDARNHVDLDAGVFDGATGNKHANTLTAEGHSRSVQISGGGGNDTITGGAGDDRLSGDEGTDQLRGGDGDDTLFVDADDLGAGGVVSGGRGLDTIIVAGSEGVTLNLADRSAEGAVGGKGHDAITGAGLNDDLMISGGAGNDALSGGGGDDNVSGDEGHDRVTGAEGDDALFGGTGNDTLSGNSGDDFVLAGTGHDSVTGSSGDDVLMGDAWDDSIAGGDHDDMIFGGTGNDTLSGQSGDDRIFAGTGNDVLHYWRGDDELWGESGDDTFRLINDVEGSDAKHWGWAIFQGGKGRDTVVVVGRQSDWTIEHIRGNQWQIAREESPSEKVYIDLVDIETLRFADGTTRTLSTNTEIDTSDDYVRSSPNRWSGDSSPTEGGDKSFEVNGVLCGWMGNDVLSTDSTIKGGTGDDRIYADDNQPASLTGEEGSDVIVGKGGRDSLIGGSGTDQMAGGAGNDRLIGGTGADLMWGDGGDDSITGDSGSDLIDGGSGNDTIEGGTGADQISGGSGDDVIVGDTGADRLAGDDGNDRIFGREGFDNLSGGSGNDRLYGGEGFNRVWGDNGEDALFGGSDDDELFGGEGDDEIFGGVGRDIVHGGAGADVMDGGEGILDQLSYADAKSAVRINLAAGTAAGGQAQGDRFTGFEQVFGGIGNDILGGDVVDNVLGGSDGDDQLNGRQGHDDLFGGAGDDKIYGEDGLDRLHGDAGDDTLVGGRGADTFFGGGGVDFISYEDANGAVVFDWGNWRNRTGDAEGDVLGGGIQGMIGSDFADRIIAGNGGNRLFGAKGNDTLEGGDGDDLLDGEEGVDTLTGGAGDDTYVTNGVDVIIEAAGGGSDTVRASVSFQLEDHFEHLVLTGSGDLDGTGNERNNSITGNSGDNILAGWGGDDRLFGGNGADRLRGNDGDDRLSGGAGTDWLTGGAGEDSFVFDQSLSSENADRITDFNAGDDTIRIDNSVFAGLTVGTLSASAFVRNSSGNAADASDRIIYEIDTGELYFDKDGSGSAAKVLFATIGTNITLTSADFLVF
jgi:Ca2+-binding RTX toxin-like protein